MTFGAPCVLAAALLVAACGSDAPTASGPGDTTGTTAAAAATTATTASTPTTAAGAKAATSAVRDLLDPSRTVRLVPEVVSTVAHDPTAFTQGLEHHDGFLLESTGGYGTSDRRRVDPDTGEVASRVALPPTQFGEGLTVADGRLIQLTWREGVAHIADPGTLQATAQWTYATEGWGICFDGERLAMSDGSASVVFRHRHTFEPVGTVEVTLDGRPLGLLNELECADGLIWANVWLSTDIVAIEPATGEVRAVVDAAALVPQGLDDEDAVLNGIARRPGTDTFWVTGKLWPVLYEVRLVPAG